MSGGDLHGFYTSLGGRTSIYHTVARWDAFGWLRGILLFEPGDMLECCDDLKDVEFLMSRQFLIIVEHIHC